MADIRKIFEDITTHIFLEGVDSALIDCPKRGEKTVSAVDESRTVVVKGILKEDVPDLRGRVGLKSISVLKAMLNNRLFKTEGSTVEIVRKNHPVKNETFPFEIIFQNEKGYSLRYRFVGDDMVPQPPKVKSDVTWDVDLGTLQKETLDDMHKLFFLFKTAEDLFSIEIKDKAVYANVGDSEASLHSASMMLKEISEDVESTNEKIFWPLSMVMRILKIAGDDGNVKISLKGAMLVIHETDLFRWEYIIPAKKKWSPQNQ